MNYSSENLQLLIFVKLFSGKGLEELRICDDKFAASFAFDTEDPRLSRFTINQTNHDNNDWTVSINTIKKTGFKDPQDAMCFSMGYIDLQSGFFSNMLGLEFGLSMRFFAKSVKGEDLRVDVIPSKEFDEELQVVIHGGEFVMTFDGLKNADIALDLAEKRVQLSEWISPVIDTEKSQCRACGIFRRDPNASSEPEAATMH